MDESAKTAVVASLLGQSLKHYRIDGILGQGGMGIVYRAHDLKLQRPVAVKLLSAELTGSADRRKRFLQEARAAARVSHPAIAQIYDVDDHDGTVFIAMELVEGRNVRDLINSGGLDLLGILDIVVQVAGGLSKAHESGIVHRDIKPANVVVTPDGHAKILDFGLAKLLDLEDSTMASTAGGADLSTMTRTQVGTLKGTPAYMSPEQVMGHIVDGRSDLFSLGVMLFEMATGTSPFQRGTFMETLHAVAHDSAPALQGLRPNLPAALQRIVARCLRKEPKDRYPDARSLTEDLRALRRETESGQARPFSLRERLGDAVENVAHLSPVQYAWIGGAAVLLAGAVYLLASNVGGGGFLGLSVLGLLVYRRVRHQPRRMLQLFVRKIAKLPEVRMITSRDRSITVVVDRASSQLYSRINTQTEFCNGKLFFGDPFTVSIRQELTHDETRQLLTSPGVHHVRDDVTPVT
jgi:tRNA A-37 threonylcarbamoyl transferase component Bud32